MRSPFHADVGQQIEDPAPDGFLASTQDPRLDDLTRLASLICGTPIALVGVFDAQRQWFKSRVGWDIDEIPRNLSLCTQTVLERRVLVIGDTLKNAQTARSPLVTHGGIRFYAGAPLLTSKGTVLGTLCVMDMIPRALSDEHVDALRRLANQAVHLIEAHPSVGQIRNSGCSKWPNRESNPIPEGADSASGDVYRAVVEAARDAILIINDQSTILYANRGAGATFGYEVEELIGKSLTDLMPEYLRHRHEWAMTSYLATHEKHLTWDRVELPGLHRSGREVLLEVSLSETVHHSKHIFAGICRDVTERRRLERDRARLAAIVEWSDDAVIGKDLNGIITSWNKGAEKLYGYSADEIVGAPLSVIAPPERAGEIADILEKLKRGERTEQYETVRVTKDGRHIQVSLTVSPIRDEKGTIIGASSVARDITERKRTEERYRALFEGAAHGVCRLNRSSEVVEANPALARMLGYTSAEELAGLKANDFFLDTESTVIERCKGAGRLAEEVKWRRRDGKIITVRLGGRPMFDQKGSIEGFEFITEDVTERRALEEQLRQIQKMDALGQLAGGIAHEFNNFLGIILGYSDLLSQASAADAQLRGHVSEIKAATQRAASLTRQLLAFSRKQALELRVVDLNTMIWETHKLLRRLIPVNVDIVPVLEPNLRQVVADPGQIQQLLLNLTINACDAMPKGGKITIETKNQELDGAFCVMHPEVRPGHYVHLRVRDSGCGMSEEVMSRIFEPFFTTKEPGKGTGLGLSAVYGIVRQAGGYITAQSFPANGTVFDIYLPSLLESAKTQEVSTAWDSNHLARERILVVEDEAALRRLLCVSLEKQGYDVLSAKDGAEAIEICTRQQGPIHLIITDILMPRLNGLELKRRVAEVRPNTKFLFMSALSGGLAAEDKLLVEASGFLEKPFLLGELVKKVAELVKSEAAA